MYRLHFSKRPQRFRLEGHAARDKAGLGDNTRTGIPTRIYIAGHCVLTLTFVLAAAISPGLHECWKNVFGIGSSFSGQTAGADASQSALAMIVPPQENGMTSVSESQSLTEKDVSSTRALTDFENRCHSPGVIRCIGFDSASEIAGSYGSNSGVLAGTTTPAIDTTVKASGSGSLKFTVPPFSGANTSGSYFANFSPDLGQQVGENSEMYLQWRQKFSQDFLNTRYENAEGWKQAIIGTGDKTGHLYSSCTDLEVVIQNGYQRGFPTIYNSCSGSSSHGPYDGFQEHYGAYDFKLQNARLEPFCLYSQGKTNPPTFFPPKGNCFGYFADEWMTFQIYIQTGPRVKDEFTNSHVKFWIARDSQQSQLVIDWGPYNLTAGAASEDQRFGKI